MSDPFVKEFIEVLASLNGAFVQAEASTRWMPDDGEYDVLLDEVRSGKRAVKKGANAGASYFYLAPKYMIVDGPLKGKSFSGGQFNFFKGADPEAAATQLSIFKSFAAVIYDKEMVPDDLEEAARYICSQTRKAFLRVRVVTSTKDGRSYKNVYAQTKLATGQDVGAGAGASEQLDTPASPS